MHRLLVVLSATALTVTLTSVSAEDGDRKREGGKKADFRSLFEELTQKGYTKEQIREIVGKAQKGEKLSAEEEEIAKKVQEARTAAGGDRGDRGGRDRGDNQGGRPDRGDMMRRMMQMRGQQNQFAKVAMNPLDATYHDLAETQYKAQKYVEAVEALKVIVDKSPDKDAKSAARFNAAQIYRHGLNYYSHAAEEYLQVQGKLRSRSFRELLDMFQNEAKDPQLAIDTLKELAGVTQDKGDKVDILRALASAYSQSEKHDDAVATLNSITKMLTYEEAVEMKEHFTQGDSEETLQGENQRMSGFGMPWMRGGRGGRGGGGFGGPPPQGGQGRPQGPGGAPAAGGADRPPLEN